MAAAAASHGGGGGGKRLHIIGFGAVGQALNRLFVHLRSASPAALAAFESVTFYAPELTAAREAADGTRWVPIPAVTRETLAGIVAGFGLRAGDIVLELATRVDTPTIWQAVKAAGAHFINTGFDSWADQELDLEALDELKSHAAWSAGAGVTAVLSHGFNPGVISNVVRHALFLATGLPDAGAAAEAFGLAGIALCERDTQVGRPGSAGGALLEATKTTVLYNTWSPVNYLVETCESTVLYPGIPAGALKCGAAGPTMVGWIPTGPIVGLMAPHDETFTIQPWFGGRVVPALFIYEACPAARAYVKSGVAEHSEKATCKLLTPAAYDVDAAGYDHLGALLYSSKPGTPPFWCGITMSVADAAVIDPTGAAGPTALQVTGGVWAALQFVLTHPSAGDCFAEDIPSDFVMRHAFPTCGHLSARSVPEVLAVPGLFNPASPTALEEILAGEPPAGGVTPAADGAAGLTAAVPFRVAGAILQLPVTGTTPAAARAAHIGHSAAANAYIDRNRTVRAWRAIPAGEAVTIDYAMLYTSDDGAVKFEAPACAGSPAEAITNWTVRPAATLARYTRGAPIDEPVLADIRAYFAAGH